MWKMPPVATVGQRTSVEPQVAGEREIHVRNLRFELDGRQVRTWHPMGAHVVHWFDAWSLFFPASESFFIESVRCFEGQIRSPELRAQAQRFIGQEAIHGREHQRYNMLLQDAGLPAQYLAKRVQNFFRWIGRHVSAKAQLAMTAGGEHLTAMMADTFLSNERLLEGCEPNYAALWTWHAIEETEHKAVAFDVYREVSAADWLQYPRRVGTMLAVSLALGSSALVFYVVLMARDGLAWDLRRWAKLMRFLFLAPGLLRGQLRRYLDYFRRDFHPWQYDNYHKVARSKAVKLPCDSREERRLQSGSA